MLPHQTTTDTIVTTVFTEPAADVQNVSATDFKLLGRISIQSGSERSSGSFRWHHLALSDEILLFTPLGQAEITKDHDGALDYS